MTIDKKVDRKINRYYKVKDTGKVKLNSSSNNIYIYRLFGHNLVKKKKIRNDKPVLYFKINRYQDYTLQCIQEWINIAYELDYDFYFVCDNDKLKYDIVRKCYFKNNDVRFLYSMRHKLKKVAFNLCTSKWINVTYAHLTPFYHAKMNNIKEFWNIDADDTTILLEPKKVAQLLKEAEAKSKKDKISCYALDMWRSKTNNIHWSLGVFFVNGLTDFVDVFEKERNLDWTKTLEEYDRQFNLDWYMTYLKNTSNIKISTFYPDNTAFIHWGNFILNVSGCWFNYWKDGKIYYPIMNSVYHNEELASTLIGDCDKIDLGNSLEESFEFLESEIPICRFFSEKGRKTNRLTSFCTKGKQIIKVR